MPKTPRDVSQQRAIRALVRAGGEEHSGRGKGSHRLVRMPNGARLVVPRKLGPGLLRALVAEAGLTLDESLEKL